ncbi:unnamed protein product [Closterium sp. NIES-65]|nr:unnamed protein product [Closterium sp. NIES-65]
MGASGSGKTTLLDILSHRISLPSTPPQMPSALEPLPSPSASPPPDIPPSIAALPTPTTALSSSITLNGAPVTPLYSSTPALSPSITLNGAPVTASTMRRVSAYVMQDDLLFPALTVRETLLFAAELRLGNGRVGRREKEEKVEGLMRLLGLSRVADSRIGDENRRYVNRDPRVWYGMTVPAGAVGQKEKVEGLMRLLGLTRVADSRIGEENRRGVSGGERKRVAIGVEMVGDPSLLFLDEPTSGLDSTCAFHVVKAVRDVARLRNSIVLMVLHQAVRDVARLRLSIVLMVLHQVKLGETMGGEVRPGENWVLNLLDNLLLLGSGHTVFWGCPSELPGYLTEFGCPAPAFSNPVEFTLDLIQSLQMDGQQEGQGGLGGETEGGQGGRGGLGGTRSQEGGNVGEKGQEGQEGQDRLKGGEEQEDVEAQGGVKVNGGAQQASGGAGTSGIQRLAEFHREWVRTKEIRAGAKGTESNLQAAAEVLEAEVGQREGDGKKSRSNSGTRGVHERLAFIAFLTCTLFFSSGDATPLFIQERNIFVRETTHNAYRPCTYLLASTLVYLPLHLLMSLAITLEAWWCLSLTGGAAGLAFMVLVCFCCLFTGNAIATFVSATVNNVILAYAVVITVLANFALVCGFYIERASIPSYWLWLHYISPLKYAYEALALNEFDRVTSLCYLSARDIYSSTPLSVLLDEVDVQRSLVALRPALIGSPFAEVSTSTCLQTGPELAAFYLGLTQLDKWQCVAILFSIGLNQGFLPAAAAAAAMDWFSAQVTSLGLGELPDIAGAVNKLSETVMNIDTSGFDGGLGLDFLPPVIEDKPAASSSSQATKPRATTDGARTAAAPPTYLILSFPPVSPIILSHALSDKPAASSSSQTAKPRATTDGARNAPAPPTATARASAPAAAPTAAFPAKDKVQEAAVGSKTPEKAASKPVTGTAEAFPARSALTAENASAAAAGGGSAAGNLVKGKEAEAKAAVGGGAKPEVSEGKDEVVKEEEKVEKEKKAEKKPTKIVKLVKGKLTKPQAEAEAAATAGAGGESTLVPSAAAPIVSPALDTPSVIAAGEAAAAPVASPGVDASVQIASSAAVANQEVSSGAVDGAGVVAKVEEGEEGGAGWAIDEVLPGNQATVPASPRLGDKPDAESATSAPEPVAAATAEAVAESEVEEEPKPTPGSAEGEAVAGMGAFQAEEGEGWAAVIEEEDIVTNGGEAAFPGTDAGSRDGFKKSEDAAAGDDAAGAAGSAAGVSADSAAVDAGAGAGTGAGDDGASAAVAAANASSTPLPFSGFEAASEAVFSIDDGEGDGEEDGEGAPAPSPVKPSLSPPVRSPVQSPVKSPVKPPVRWAASEVEAAAGDEAAAEREPAVDSGAAASEGGERGCEAAVQTSEEETRSLNQESGAEEEKVVTQIDVEAEADSGEADSGEVGLGKVDPGQTHAGEGADVPSEERLMPAAPAAAEGAEAAAAAAAAETATAVAAEAAAAQEGVEGAWGEGGRSAAGNGLVNEQHPVSPFEKMGAAEKAGAAGTDGNGWAVGSGRAEEEAVPAGDVPGEEVAPGVVVNGEGVQGTAGAGAGEAAAGAVALVDAAAAEMVGSDTAASVEAGSAAAAAAAAAAVSVAENISDAGATEARGANESEGSDGAAAAAEAVPAEKPPPEAAAAEKGSSVEQAATVAAVAAEGEALSAETATAAAAAAAVAAAEALSTEKASSAAAAAVAEALSSELQAELVRVKMELATMESALQNAGKQAQTKADELARAMTVNDELRAELEDWKVSDWASGLQNAGRQAQTQADELVRAMTVNDELRAELEDWKAKKNNDAELEALREEYQHRLGAAERKVYALTKERDMLRREQSRKADTSTLLKEKDEIIRQVMAEGEELSKKQAAQEGAMKKLRTQLREMEEERTRLQNRLQVEEARVESIKKDKAATEKALQDAVERGQADLAAQKDFYVSALSAAREAQAAAEARADSEAKAEAERKLKEAGERERALVMTVEELRQALTRSEQQAGFREQMLRRDLEDMEKRCQAAEARHEELVARIPESTRPLLRQIEAMQESANTRMEALSGVERALNARLQVRVCLWLQVDCESMLRQIEAMQESASTRMEALSGVERALNARLQEAEAKAAVAEERERVTSERLNQTLSRLAVMEAQLSCLRAEHSQLSRSLDKERQRAAENRTEYLSAQEAKVAAEGRVKVVEEELREVKGRWRKEVQEERQRRELVEQELESERASMAEHERKIRAEGRAAAEKALVAAHAAAGSSYPELSVRQSLRRVPSSSSVGSSAIEEATASGILAASLLPEGSSSHSDLLTGAIIVRQSLRRVPSSSSAGSSAIEEATASGILAASLLPGGSSSHSDLLSGAIIGGTSSSGGGGGGFGMLGASASMGALGGGMGGGMGGGVGMGYGGASGGGLLRPSAANAATVEHLESLLRQKDGEIATHTARLAALESTRDSLAEELVKTTTQCESLRSEVTQLPGLKAELEAIRRRHASALELMGERDEQLPGLKAELEAIRRRHASALELMGERDEQVQLGWDVEELRADLMDVKQMYREQIDMLVDQVRRGWGKNGVIRWGDGT